MEYALSIRQGRVLPGAEFERPAGVDSNDPQIRRKVPALENPGLVVLVRGRSHSSAPETSNLLHYKKIAAGVDSCPARNFISHSNRNQTPSR